MQPTFINISSPAGELVAPQVEIFLTSHSLHMSPRYKAPQIAGTDKSPHPPLHPPSEDLTGLPSHIKQTRPAHVIQSRQLHPRSAYPEAHCRYHIGHTAPAPIPAICGYSCDLAVVTPSGYANTIPCGLHRSWRQALPFLPSLCGPVVYGIPLCLLLALSCHGRPIIPAASGECRPRRHKSHWPYTLHPERTHPPHVLSS